MLNYLIEIRKRLIIILLSFCGFFILFFFFTEPLFHLLMKPLISVLPAPHSLIAINVTSPVFTPIRLAGSAALLCSAPIILFNSWRFIAPALYREERSSLQKTIGASLVLFSLGVFFCFYIVLPFMFQFFLHALPSDVKMMPDMTSALDFIIHMLLLFGFCFQIPLICVSLVRIGWLDVALLQKIRPYAIVGAFILGMLLTPPDVLSQIMLAVPLCILYELGIIFAKKVARSQ